jgi:hypothetical protein
MAFVDIFEFAGCRCEDLVLLASSSSSSLSGVPVKECVLVEVEKRGEV